MTTTVNTSAATAHHRGSKLLVLIGIFKIAKALLLIIAALVTLRLINQNLGDVITKTAQHLHVAPGNRRLEELLAKSLSITPRKLELVATVMLVYAGMFATEGVGLVLKQHWAEWMAVITTVGLIPFEIYEIFEKPSPLKIAALVVNIVIAIYLAIRALHENKDKHPAVSSPS